MGGWWRNRGRQREFEQARCATLVDDKHSFAASKHANGQESDLGDCVSAHDSVAPICALGQLTHIGEPVECAEYVSIGSELCQTRPI